MSDINIIRLSTGEELIATVTRVETGLELTDVAILIPTQQNSLGLAPFLAYAKYEKLHLNSKDVMFRVDPVDDLKSQYQQMFNKIVTPKTSIIT
jgi:hypothetical protein